MTYSRRSCDVCRHAKGIVSKSGRYGGGTYAHSDIALSFASWISPEFMGIVLVLHGL
jgi:hypothetical protein